MVRCGRCRTGRFSQSLGIEYGGISEIIGKSEINCRKLFSRAKGKIGTGAGEPDVVESDKEMWVRLSVSKFLFGSFHKLYQQEGVQIEISMINGQTGVIFRVGEHVDSVALFHSTGHLIRNIYLIRNPDKLRHFEHS